MEFLTEVVEGVLARDVHISLNNLSVRKSQAGKVATHEWGPH